jgi:branched-chain amino acid transport system permease protein
MAVGAYAAYNLQLRVEGMPAVLAFLLAGLCAAGTGVLFGLPTLRIKGYYLAVATLAAQFFIVWALTKFPWFSDHSASGVISAQRIVVAGLAIDTPVRKYLFVLAFVAVLVLLAANLARSHIGRAWMAVRDMNVAAEVIGIPLLRTKLVAFAISSFYCGVAGALYAYCYLGSVEPDGFSLDLSLRILFMVIVGGVGSVLGSFLGAGFILLLPIVLERALVPLAALLHLRLASEDLSHIQLMAFGALIIVFLIAEPHGLARLWRLAKEKLRLWPFPH